MQANESWHHVGQRIRSLRKLHGLTLKQLARGCDLSTNAISLVERGEVAPTIATLCKIASALGSSVGALLQEVCPSEVVVVRAGMGGSEPPAHKLAGNIFEQVIVPRPGECSLDPSLGQANRQFALCLAGQVEFEDQDCQAHALQPGDRLQCNSEALQRWRNLGRDTAIVILVLPPQPLAGLERLASSNLIQEVD